ncbi:Acetyl-CoA hydrolase/transferase [uncultured Desulfobacterium sp.]|uniref:Acetyl-CoA hydrolase/transferase n=1 Tax=uncultured Desulfobacterium sp. TaxID=201089 RepID=A0A445MS62_9BACT|nr:Acetyl-CoA hydrolase/transferase [uncultured Desulfobacterium sp.]
MNFSEEYKNKLISAEEAAGLVKSGMWVDYGSILSFPSLVDEELAKRVSALEGVKIRSCLSLKDPEVLKADPDGNHFIYNEWHLSEHTRRHHDNGCCSYIPYNLSEGAKLYRNNYAYSPDIAFMGVTPMSRHGFFNFGSIEKNKAICDAARTVVLEVNPSMPWLTGGFDECIHISQVDCIVENDKYKVYERSQGVSSSVDIAIAGLIADLIEDESTIQLGIGGLPDEVGRLLIERGAKDLGVHTEMFTESMMEMFEAGVITNRKKTLNPGKAVCNFAVGSRRLYEFVDHNEMIAAFPVDYTNNPAIIAQNAKQVSVNSALAVDLRGQVSSESNGNRHISGTGGQLDFTRGAFMSPGGKSIICLSSTHQNKNGNVISRIVANHPAGTVVTVPRTDVSNIATEFGVVNLKGKTVWERATALIGISHPDFREDLMKQARDLNIIPKGI